MKFRFRLYVTAAVIGLLSWVPSVSARYQNTETQAIAMVQAPSQTPPSAQPSPSPSGQTAPSDPNTTTQPDYNTQTTAIDRSDTTRAFSWGSFLGGVVLGAIIGYILGRRPTATVDVRRDRAA